MPCSFQLGENAIEKLKLAGRTDYVVIDMITFFGEKERVVADL